MSSYLYGNYINEMVNDGYMLSKKPNDLLLDLNLYMENFNNFISIYLEEDNIFYSYLNESEGSNSLKDKIKAIIDKFLEWCKTIKRKIVAFIKGGATSASKVEENFKKAAQGAKSVKHESYSMFYESEEDDRIAKANEDIYQLFEKNKPVYVFRAGLSTPNDFTINSFKESLDKAIKDKDKNCIDDFYSASLKEDGDGSVDKYFENKVDTYSSKGTISANKDYVTNGLQYFMDDFKKIDNYLKNALNRLSSLETFLHALQLRCNRAADKVELDIYKACMKELGAMIQITNKYIKEMTKTKSVITKASEIAVHAVYNLD